MLKPKKFVEEKVKWLKGSIGEKTTIAAVSGGVDSTVTAVLGHMAVGKKLTAIFLDDGLMREGEPQRVYRRLRQLGVNVKIYDVSNEFFRALKGLTDPEEKRKAFRETFYRVLARISRELGAEYLLQGTIAADVVETKGGVKTQHNVLEQININPLEKYGFKVLEPLKELYKDKVRAVARALNLRPEISRRPYPGPGLSVRIIGEVTPERVAVVRRATKVVEEETKNIRCFQAFAVLMQDKATGVTEKRGRKYGEIIVIRAVQSKDAITAKTVELPWRTLMRIERKIRKENPTVTHVLYDLTGKPPATIEFE